MRLRIWFRMQQNLKGYQILRRTMFTCSTLSLMKTPPVYVLCMFEELGWDTHNATLQIASSTKEEMERNLFGGGDRTLSGQGLSFSRPMPQVRCRSTSTQLLRSTRVTFACSGKVSSIHPKTSKRTLNYVIFALLRSTLCFSATQGGGLAPCHTRTSACALARR